MHTGIVCLVWLGSLLMGQNDGEKLFHATPLTEEGSFTPGIEGPACDAQGNIYAVNFQEQETIGKVTPQGSSPHR